MSSTARCDATAEWFAFQRSKPASAASLLGEFATTISGIFAFRFDAPDAGTGFLLGTFPRAVNELGEVTGSYVDTHGDNHGFVRDAQGNLTEFSGPDAYDTVAFSSNSSGKTVGIWASIQQFGGGFVRDRSGALTTFSVPMRNTGTAPMDINDAGQITGFWADDGQRAYHGFVQVN